MGKCLGMAMVCVCVATGACSTVHEELPTRPGPSEGVSGGPLVPDAPTSPPVPTPEVPVPPPAPGGGGGSGSGEVAGFCGDPAPPSVSRIKIGTLSGRPGRRVLNSTPLVGPDAAYCQLIGYTDGRLYCPVRPEGHPERVACEAAQVGHAADTGRIGPTWTADGQPCQGQTGGASCQNHPDNQFLVIAYGAGTFEACTATGVCGRYVVP
jgi:hypothetical protein